MATGTDHDTDLSWTAKHNISHQEAPFLQKEVALRVVVGVTCFFAIVGALVIILSYCLDKEIRTKSRQILVHLSIADLGVALANLIGVIVYFDQYIRSCTTDLDVLTPSNSHLQEEVHNVTVFAQHSSGHIKVSCRVLYGLCKAQAFVAGYSTLASVLWTQTLAVYIYCLVVLPNSKIYGRVVYFAYVFCWVMPLLICFWLIFTDRLGYSPHGGEGWCSLKIIDDNNNLNTFVVVLANDFWIYLTFITVTVLYLSTHCYIKVQLPPSTSSMNVVNKADTKFLLIPCCFLLLRIWTQILIILFVYVKLQLPIGVTRFLLYASGIGDSGQGIVNAFLFCILTPKVRQKLLNCFVHVLCCVWVCHTCCKKMKLHCCRRDKDGYSTIHSMATVDLQNSNSVSFPVLQPKGKRYYSTCTISTTSGSSDAELSPAMYQ